MTDVRVYLNHDNNELEPDEDTDKATFEAWERDGGRLREEWKKQLKEFNKKNPMWANYIHTAGCVRSVLWNQSKLPAARAKGKSNIGHFDLEMFHSMKTAPSRTDLPAYWKKEFTS